MLTINTNLSSLIVQSNLKTSTKGLNIAIERMTTGFKLNHAKDNAANYSISTSLTTKLGAYTVAEENAMMGLDMVQTASSSLSQMSDLASRLRSLAMQAQNGTYGSTSLDALNSEANAIVKELFRIQNTTQYNGIYLLNGGTSTNIATNAVATLNSASTTSTQSSPRATSSGFIEAVQKRDTSAMTTLASVDENTTLDSGTYSISTAEELAKLATMTNNGNVTGNAEFVLANDIDLSAYRENGGWTPIGNIVYGDNDDDDISGFYFSGIFDGNGYKVKNLYINSYGNSDDNVAALGLFGMMQDGEIKNLKLENVNIDTDGSGVGGLVGVVAEGNVTINNVTVAGNLTGCKSLGGLVGAVGEAKLTLTNCSANTSITGEDYLGGLLGMAFTNQDITINNSYSLGSVSGNKYLGGFIGGALSSGINIVNSYSTSVVSGNSYTGALVGEGHNISSNNVYFTENTGQANAFGSSYSSVSGTATQITNKELKALIAQGILPNYLGSNLNVGLQIGNYDSDSDKLNFSIEQIDIVPLNGLNISSAGALDAIDDFLKSINEQQTSLGAVENRLMSAIESIGVNINNLTSTRSTIKDADVAELSSEYIRNQILQQASATLLATANQNPSIALQLI